MSEAEDVEGEAESMVRFARRDAEDIAWLGREGMITVYCLKLVG